MSTRSNLQSKMVMEDGTDLGKSNGGDNGYNSILR
jgi:hypothetical protein